MRKTHGFQTERAGTTRSGRQPDPELAAPSLPAGRPHSLCPGPRRAAQAAWLCCQQQQQQHSCRRPQR